MTAISSDRAKNDVSRSLARAVVRSRHNDIPEHAHQEARRALLNYMGCALGGADHPAVDMALEGLGFMSGPPKAAIVGRTEAVDMALAAFVNGISSHVHDYDDTTPSNYIHPSSPIASALFAFASTTPVKGEDFIHAFVLGFDAVTRIGDATYPAHYQAGWHSTGSVGVFGAAIAIGKLLELSEEQMLWAIGLAASQAAGLRDNFGSMTKSFHPGAAARSGLEAALLAKVGFTTGSTPLEGPRGFAAATANNQADFTKITDGLGQEFRLSGNTYKPFPCGIVVHPTIDACCELHREGLRADSIESVELRVAPLVRDLCDIRSPEVGLQGKFSIYHAAAIGLVRGKGGLAEFTDDAIHDPQISAMRSRVQAIPDTAVDEDSVHVTLLMKDGSRIERFLEASLGNLKRPLSDAQLEEKFRDQVSVLNPERVDSIITKCRRIAALDNVGDLIRLTAPEPAPKDA
ncbi:MmgE/PrpD family protein [Halomonas sp. TRM85114]|uniref:MmgE/PrpD family protein n=1 Tax=Halomonas jincaotanensis TaxID=2810616 RepID=UPI001BD61F3C|nr:MmgE/PrpD family protein [Halomonas jincaotanensis]MBS9403658.1 MmgE/PrpD family protein [Halomonas jincaotanensis]